MVKKYSLILLMSIGICILQQAVLSRITLMGYTFDSVYVFLICYALTGQEIDTFIMAILCGLVRDSFFPHIFGLNSIVYVTSVFIIVQINKRIYKSILLIPFFITALFTLYKGLVYFSYFYISSLKFDFMKDTLGVLLYESIYNAILSLFLYRVIVKIVNSKIIQHEWKF